MPVNTLASPPWWRIAIALLVAPLIASVAYAVYNPAYEGLADMTERVIRTIPLVAFVGAYPPTILLGVPLLFYLKGRVRPSLANCAAVGGVVATIPRICLVAFYGPDQVTRWWGLIDVLKWLAETAMFGFAAGGLFWLMAAAGIKRHPLSDTAPSKVFE
jgi:hypothetical protein